MRCVVSYIIN